MAGPGELVLGTMPKFDEHFLVKAEAGGSLGDLAIALAAALTRLTR